MDPGKAAEGWIAFAWYEARLMQLVSDTAEPLSQWLGALI